ncbi:3429_t:CDS:2 [Rhizophagus irregularis]|nr:3429_t:CDS:2 [Rhizophagus irregularis]
MELEQFKLNHGLVLNGTDIKSSIQRVTAEDGELKINLYKGQPLVYTCINSEDNDLELDTCINFPVAEIIYNVSVNVRHNDSIVSQSLNIQLEPNDKESEIHDM